MTRHYDELLAAHYTWMFGAPYAALVEEQRDLLREAGVAGPAGTGLAVDLGCGSGFQTLALAELGYSRILAVDSSAALLAELKEHADRYSGVGTALGDLCQAARDLDAGSVELAVCMGDTLTHLPDRSSVAGLFADLYAALAPGGRLVLTFRDLTRPLTGNDRFLPVYADAERILTCFLEYGPDSVTVHDVLYRRTGSPGWGLSVGSYAKLRIDGDWVAGRLRGAGFTVDHQGPAPRRMELVTAIRP